MKAKEYFKSYKNKLTEENKVGTELNHKYYCFVYCLMDLFNEVEKIKELRKAKSDKAIISIMNEQNLKANSLLKMVNTEFNLQISRDAFKGFITEQMPELSKMIGWS